MELKEVRKIFYEKMNGKKKSFAIKIRENGDFVYYNGIKIFEIKDGMLKISSNNYELDSAFLEEHLDSLSNDYSRSKLFKALSKFRMQLLDNGLIKIRKKMLIRYEKSLTKSYKEYDSIILKNKDFILKNVRNNMKDYSKYVNLNDTCINKNGNKMCCCSIDEEMRLNDFDDEKTKLNKTLNIINIEYVLLNEFSNAKIETKNLINGTSGWKKPTSLIYETVSYSVSKLDIEKLSVIINTMKKIIDDYSNTIFEIRNYYQHQFMTDKKVLKKFKDFGVDKIYRFEENYYVFNSTNKGKVDCIFVSLDGKDIYLIELKTDRNEIKGLNGIHQNLIDIEDLCDIKQDNFSAFIHKLKKNVDYCRKSLGQEKIKFSNKINLHYWIIIACSSKKEKEYIKNEILDKYNIFSNLNKVKKILECKNGYKNRVLTLDNHMNNLEKMNCEVKILFDIFDYDKKDKKFNMMSNKFESYRVNSAK